MDDIDPADFPSLAGQEIAPGVLVRAGGLRIQYSRSAGPGGQNVNKVNSKAELWVRIDSLIGLSGRAIERLRALAGSRITREDEIHLRAEAERSQEANRQDVLDRLRQMIIQARVEPKMRRRTRPTKASKRRRLESKRHRGQIKSSRRGDSDED